MPIAKTNPSRLSIRAHKRCSIRFASDHRAMSIVYLNGKCRNHGGMITGAKTDEGSLDDKKSVDLIKRSCCPLVIGKLQHAGFMRASHGLFNDFINV